MTDEPIQVVSSNPANISRIPQWFLHFALVFGIFTICAALMGLAAWNLGFNIGNQSNQQFRTIAFSAALFWTFLGLVVVIRSVKPISWGIRRAFQILLIILAAVEAAGFIFSVFGIRFVIEDFFVGTGREILGASSQSISPAASALITLGSIALVLLLADPYELEKSGKNRDRACIIGITIVLASFTFAYSYIYGSPLLYGSQFIPMAFFSALAGLFFGVALIGSAGPGVFPTRYFVGNSTTAHLFRIFIPLIIGIVLLENFAFVFLASWFDVRDAVLLSASLVLFIVITASLVSRVSASIGSALEYAEEELVKRNKTLNGLNEELTIIHEELRQTNETLLTNEQQLMQKNEELNALNEELTSTQEELSQNLEELCKREQELNATLAEKEVLLSEIHHRVKNNLTAFISLLSLEGATEDAPAVKTLLLDLQNRARSMALIHETLYKTHKFDKVDMGQYLNTLVGQVTNSFRIARPVSTTVDANGVMLDLHRATPIGLIVNELVTNSFKYAFPQSFDVESVRGDPPAIRIALTQCDGGYAMSVSDNGVGLSHEIDIATTKTLGLKLVNFLAKHQLQATIDVDIRNGTELVFRFRENNH